MTPQIVNLNAIVGEMAGMLPRLIGENVDLRMHLADDLRQCKADPAHIQQIIMNLAVNARDAMPKGGRLVVETANVELDCSYASRHSPLLPGNYVMLAVSDTGVGMSPAIQARIFEPFFTTKGMGKGTGLGLSTVYGIVQQNGGYVLIYSEVGRGSTFKVYLPTVDGPVLARAPQVDRDLIQGSGTVLFVEDEASLRKAGAEFLSASGYRVLVAGSGEEALEVVSTSPEPVDVLVTDVIMPVITGPELAHCLLESYPEMHIIYMSGYSDNACQVGGEFLSAVYLQKPFSFRLLAERVMQVSCGVADRR